MFSNIKAGKPPVSLWSGNISICCPRGPALVSMQLYGDRSLLWLWGKSPRLFCVNPLKSYRAIVRWLPRPSPALPGEYKPHYFCLHIRKVNFRENLSLQTFFKSCMSSKYNGWREVVYQDIWTIGEPFLWRRRKKWAWKWLHHLSSKHIMSRF